MLPKKDFKKTISVDQDYDVQNDTLFLYSLNDYDYKNSVRMSEDIILDFDQENVPVAIEILHASKVFGVNKYSLTQPITLDMNVDVGKSFIMLEAIFTIKVRQKKEPKPVKAEAPNKSNIPVLEGVHFATA